MRKSGGLFCFSPPVMLATFAIEIILLLVVVWRYKMTARTRLAALLLFFLAAFQLAEYMVCGGLGFSGIDWSRFGFMAITMLPPLGLHLVYEVAGKKNKPLIITAYATAAVTIVYFALASNAFDANQCQGNYVIFLLPMWATWLYTLYYFGWVLTGLVQSVRWAKTAKNKKQRQALCGFAIGYSAFLLPTAGVNLLIPETLNGIPSIMCGFAIIFALILTLWVLPRRAQVKR